MSQSLRILLIVAGTFFVGLGGLGIFLPLLPTTPFLLLAAACYARSSETFYSWLLNNKWFGQHIKDWREGRGIPLKTKALSISLLLLTIGYSIAFVVTGFAIKFFLILVVIGVSTHIFLLPTLKINREV